VSREVVILLPEEKALHVTLVDEGLIEVKVTDMFGDTEHLVEITQGDNYEGHFDDGSIQEIEEF
jgi:hypothetical protein